MRGTRTVRSRRGRLIPVAVVAAAVASSGLYFSSAAAHLKPTVIERRTHVVKRALGQLGENYSYGGESPRSGFDCSGLVYWAFKDHGASLPRSSSDMWRARRRDGYKRVWKRKRLVRGDLVFFTNGGSSVGHVGLYIGRGRMVNARSSAGGVVRDSLSEDYWRSHYVGAMRVPRLRSKQ